MPTDIIISILSILLLLIIFITYRKKVTSKNEHNMSKDEYLVLLAVLDSLIDNYKNNFISPKIEKLEDGIDVDPNSQTNALAYFHEKKNELYQTSLKEIINNYLTTDQKKILSKYFSTQSLSLYIISRIKKD